MSAPSAWAGCQSAPQFKTNPLEVAKAAKAAGKEPKDYVAEGV